jgi:hypothetical protein
VHRALTEDVFGRIRYARFFTDAVSGIRRSSACPVSRDGRESDGASHAAAVLAVNATLKLLLWLDLYVLLAFIVVLSWLGRQILGLSSHLPQGASRLR